MRRDEEPAGIRLNTGDMSDLDPVAMKFTMEIFRAAPRAWMAFRFGRCPDCGNARDSEGCPACARMIDQINTRVAPQGSPIDRFVDRVE